MASIPETLKPVTSYIKLANDTEPRDPVVAYWLRVFIVQKALKIDGKSPDARKFLIELMDKLEKEKAGLKDNETVTDDVAAQAYVENYGSRLFEAADAQDRSGNATLNTVKTYLASSQLFEALSVFGEISEEITERTKYAKFRAALIMKAIKSGEKPPPPDDIDPLNSLPVPPPLDTNPSQGPVNPKDDRPSTLNFQPSSSTQPETPVTPVVPSTGHTSSGAIAENGAQISPLSVEKAMKLCKYASSALMYDDVSTAVTNLEQALALLKTGKLP